jgi:poly(3-hydroxybutyrate) depolymerase
MFRQLSAFLQSALAGIVDPNAEIDVMELKSTMTRVRSVLGSSSFLRRVGIYWLEICCGLLLIALSARLAPDAIRIWREWPRAGEQIPSRTALRLPDGSETEIRFFLYLPANYSSKQSWPLLLFLHGSGQRGNDLEWLKRSGPPAILSRGHQLPMIVVSPQCAMENNWNNDELLSLLDNLEKKFSIDPDRVFLSGYSMGGYGAWSLAAAAPERFAALVPVAGGGDTSDATKLTNVAIWDFHGAKDTTVPTSESRAMVDAVRAAGGFARLTIYADRGHSICDVTFSRSDLFDWLLQQRRANKR